MHKKVFLLDAITQARTINTADPNVTDLEGEATRILSGQSNDAVGDTVKLLSVLSNAGLSAASARICELASGCASREGNVTQQAAASGKALGDKPCSSVILARALYAASMKDVADVVSVETIFAEAFPAIANQVDRVLGEAKLASANAATAQSLLNSDASIVRAF